MCIACNVYDQLNQMSLIKLTALGHAAVSGQTMEDRIESNIRDSAGYTASRFEVPVRHSEGFWLFRISDFSKTITSDDGVSCHTTVIDK